MAINCHFLPFFLCRVIVVAPTEWAVATWWQYLIVGNTQYTEQPTKKGEDRWTTLTTLRNGWATLHLPAHNTTLRWYTTLCNGWSNVMSWTAIQEAVGRNNTITVAVSVTLSGRVVITAVRQDQHHGIHQLDFTSLNRNTMNWLLCCTRSPCSCSLEIIVEHSK